MCVNLKIITLELKYTMINKYKYMKLMEDAKNYSVKIYVYFLECFYKEKHVSIAQIILFFIYL